MAATIPGKNKIADEVQINHGDQKMINAFANKNAKFNELKQTAANRKKELQLLEDAGDELLMLDDDTIPIPVHIGEVFLHLTKDETEEYIERSKDKMDQELKECEDQMKGFESELKDLKIKLYTKFGTNINLEDDEDS